MKPRDTTLDNLVERDRPVLNFRKNCKICDFPLTPVARLRGTCRKCRDLTGRTSVRGTQYNFGD